MIDQFNEIKIFTLQFRSVIFNRSWRKTVHKYRHFSSLTKRKAQWREDVLSGQNLCLSLSPLVYNFLFFPLSLSCLSGFFFRI